MCDVMERRGCYCFCRVHKKRKKREIIKGACCSALKSIMFVTFGQQIRVTLEALYTSERCNIIKTEGVNKLLGRSSLQLGLLTCRGSCETRRQQDTPPAPPLLPLCLRHYTCTRTREHGPRGSSRVGPRGFGRLVALVPASVYGLDRSFADMTESKPESSSGPAAELLALNPDQESEFKRKVKEAKKNRTREVG